MLGVNDGCKELHVAGLGLRLNIGTEKGLQSIDPKYPATGSLASTGRGVFQ